jgi:hypothetical protein
MIRYLPDVLRHSRVIQRDAAAFAGRYCLVCMKAKDRQVRKCTRGNSLIERTVRLGRILDDRYTKGRKSVEVARMAEDVDCNQCPRSVCN